MENETTRRAAIACLLGAPVMLAASEPPASKVVYQDVILQRELRAYLMVEAVKRETALSLRRRLRAGATVEAGSVKFTSDDFKDIPDLEESSVTDFYSDGCEISLEE